MCFNLAPAELTVVDISETVVWLDDGARSASGPQGLMEELCSRLAGAGIPLERASIFVTVLHPDIAGLSSIWRRGQPVDPKPPSKRPIKEVLEEGRDPVHAVYDAIEDKGRKSETKTAADDTEPMCRTVAWLG